MEFHMQFFFLFPAIIFLLATIVHSNGGHFIQAYEQSEEAAVNTVHRAGYHFQPKKHWMNDPNGPMYYKGFYHLFYQSNPKAAFWVTGIIWGHSVSKDLINWTPLKTAIFPSKPFDKYGCWSGAATVLPGNRPVIVYTGIVDKNDSQVQNYAIPANYSDPYLVEWIKPNDNPILVPQFGINKTAFRDPTTAWLGLDGVWRIATGGRKKNIGVSWLFKSKDFKKWVKAKHPLHSVSGTGNFEMPDFFPVPIDGAYGLDNSMTGPTVKYVLKISLDLTRYDYYTVGTWSYETDKYIPDPSMVDGWTGLRIDYGNFYASKSFFDPVKCRRILWGWANESDLESDDKKKGWAGVQYIPRTIWLDRNGKQLLQWPIEEIITLRRENAQLKNQHLSKGDWLQVSGITAAQADVEVVFSFPTLDKAEIFDERWENHTGEDVCAFKGGLSEGGLGPFGLATLASNLSGEFTPVSFTIFKDSKGGGYRVLMCSDGRRSSTREEGLYRPSFGGWVDADVKLMRISLRCLIDHSIVESFGAGGKIVISSRVYPVHAIYDQAELYVFNNGTELVTIETLDAWSMKNAVVN